MGAGEPGREEVAVEPYRERIEEFIRRYGVFRVLAVAVVVLLAFLLALRGLRVLRVVAVSVLIGAVLVAGWLLIGPLLTIPRISSTGPVVRNGVAVVVACGKKQGMAGIDEAARYADEPRTGTWDHVQQGECTVWYHHPPDLGQRHARHQRAH